MHRNSHWERKLNIMTAAAYLEKDDANHSRYEPTDYAVLERLAGSGYVGSGNTLVDYGCGKGRVSFFMSHATGCKTVGVEYSEALFREALDNLRACSVKAADRNIRFVLENAEHFDPDGADRFYFFNPFSEKILRAVLDRITGSFYGSPRDMLLFFYYALDSYRTLLMGDPCLEFVREIDCRDIFQSADSRESILVFRVTGGL